MMNSLSKALQALVLLFILTLGLGGPLAAQNLVPNNSFETFSGCPNGPAQVNLATGWNTPANHGGSADYFHTCGSPIVGVPGNWAGNQAPYHGLAYMGLCPYYQAIPDFREYITTPLITPLVAGVTYECSAYYSLSETSQFTVDLLQFYFSNAPIFWAPGNYLVMNTYAPQCSIPTGTFMTDMVNWVRVSGTFVAAGGEQHVTIGNFRNDANTPLMNFPGSTGDWAYVYLDSVVVQPLNPMGVAPDTTICPGDCYQLWAFGDTSYSWTTTTNPVPFSTDDSVVVCPTVTTSYIITGGTLLDTITVTVLPAAPIVNLGPDTTICQGQSVTFNAGNPGSTYLWSPGGQVTQSITATTSGTYQVITTTTCGADTDAVVLTVVPLPTPNLGPDTAFCAGGSVVLSPGPGFGSYAWSTGATTSSISVNSTGTYSVTVTNGPGCSGSDAINVGVSLPLGLLTTSTNVTCFGGSNGTATAIGSGSAPLTYVWSAPGNPTSATITGLAAGTYTVTLTDGFSCTRTATVTVTQPAAMTSVAFGTPESCPGRDDGTALVSAAGGVMPFTYLWSNGDNTASIDSLAPGNYTVTVTDDNGCTTTSSVTIQPGNAVLANTVGNPSFCEGEGGDTLLVVGSGGVGPYYYQWWCQATMGPCGLDSVFDDDPLANPTVSGWYYVQITDGSGCQSNIDSVYMTVLPKPIVDAGADIYLCGDSAPCQVLTPTITGAPGPYTYLWSPSAGLNDPTIANPCARPDSTTIYSLVVTAGNGCASEFTTTDTLATVVVHVNPIPIADAGPDQHICFLDSALLEGIGMNAGPVYSYQWSPTTGLSAPGSRITMASPPLTTTYTLVAYSNGCPSYGDDITVFVHTVPTVNGGPNREMCLGDSVMLDAMAGGDSTANFTFIWTPGTDIDDANTEDPTVWPVSTTMYYVEARSNYGCGSSFDSVLVTLLPTPIANAGDNATVCLGNEFEFQGSYSYTTTIPANPGNVFQFWLPDAGLSDAHSLTPTATPTVSQLYTLTVYAGLCATTDSMLLTVIPELDMSASADTTVICGGDSVYVSAAAAVTNVNFSWTPTTGVGNPFGSGTYVAPGSTTTYTVVGEVGGCTDTATVTIEVIPTPVVAFLNSSNHGCAPLQISFMEDASDAIAYAWDFGDGSPISNEANPLHEYDRPGTYFVNLVATNTGGCTGSQQSTAIVVSDTARVDFHSDPAFPVELALPNTLVHFFQDAPDAVGYSWSFGDGIKSDIANPVHTYTQPGNYQVTLQVTNAEGCVSTVVKGPFLVVIPDLFIPNVFSPNGDGVNDEYIVQYTGTQPFSLQIFDRWGVKLYEGNNKNKGWKGNNADGDPVSEGVFYYRLRIGDRDFTGPITMVR